MLFDRIVSSFSWLSARWWVLLIVTTAALAAIAHSFRIQHIDYISGIAGGDELVESHESPTGYEDGLRRIILPGKNADSFQWVMQVQEQFSEGKWRLGSVDYDNAPEGRSVRTASFYRWYLGTVAWIDHLIFGKPIGLSVERASVAADPLAQFLVLAVTVPFLARWFGGWSAALFAVGWFGLFPLGGAFAPGSPGETPLLIGATLWSVLPLLAASRVVSGEGQASRNRLYGLAGMAAGLGLWLGAGGMLPILFGLFVSVAAGNLLARRKSGGAGETELYPRPWRVWAMAGSAVTLLAWLLDRSPELFAADAWRFDFVNPLYALAWLAAGEWLRFLESDRKAQGKATLGFLGLCAVTLLLCLYSVFKYWGDSAWSIDPVEDRLSRLNVGHETGGIGNWIQQSGPSPLLFVSLLPLAIGVIGIVALFDRKSGENEKRHWLLILGPTLCAIVLSFKELGWFSLLDTLLLVFAVFLFSSEKLSQSLRRGTVIATVFVSLTGSFYVYSGLSEVSRRSLDPIDLTTLVERHLAGWLNQRSDHSGEVVLAPPAVSVSLAFYGGLKVLGTPYPENDDGFSASVRLCAATTPDEARAIANGRELEFIVHPSWDPFLDEYARLGTNQPENSFIALLNQFLPPRWLQPVPFRLPPVQGLENEWVTLFRVVEVQDNASAIARLIEYFLDTGRGQQAAMAQGALENGFPREMVTRLTAAEVAIARGDRARFSQAIEALLETVEAGGADYIDWDLRLSLSLVFAGAQKIEAAKFQLEQVLNEASFESLRRLSDGSLTGLLRLSKALQVPFPDSELRDYAVSLLPNMMQSELK